MIMAIELSEQQRQAIEMQHGQPIEVVDPVTSRVYVLVAAETFERVRSLLKDDPEQAPPNVSPAGPAPADREPERVRLRDLPLAPEIAEEARRHCKKMGLWRRRYIQEVEEDLKLQYYFGGQAVYVVPTPAGREVILIGEQLRTTPGLRDVLLTPDERPHAVLEFPSPWHDSVSQILSS